MFLSSNFLCLKSHENYEKIECLKNSLQKLISLGDESNDIFHYLFITSFILRKNYF